MSKYIPLSTILAFDERRRAFYVFCRKNNIVIEKIDRKNYMSKKDIKKALKIYEKQPKQISFHGDRGETLKKTFEDIKNFF